MESKVHLTEKETPSNQLDEWKAARDVIGKFDDRIDNLRKNGFTFITGLLTAQSLLESNLMLGTPNSATNTVLPSVKVAVVTATLILIIALRLLDRSYIVQQRAAINRAMMIEKFLNIELTKTIFDAYHRRDLWIIIPILYGLFAIAAGILGCFLITGFSWAEYWIVVATVVAFILILLIQLIRTPKLNNYDMPIAEFALHSFG
jgi:hypothetical protein